MKRAKQARARTVVKDARTVVLTCIGMNLRLAERQVTRFLEERLRPCRLSVAQFSLMAHVAAARDDTIGSLADRLGLDQSTLSRNLRGLEREGLVEIVTAQSDMRQRAVWLTELGARRLEAALPLWNQANKELKRIVGPRWVNRIARASARLFAPTA